MTERMETEEKTLQELLCTKIGMELAGYKRRMLKKDTEYVFQNAYQIDCMVRIYEGLLEMSQKMVGETVQVLLVFPNLLAFLYRKWIKKEDSSTQELEDCLNENICELEKIYGALNETAGIKEENAA